MWHGMNVIGHDHEAATDATSLLEFIRQQRSDDLPTTRVIQQPASPMAGIGHKVSMQLVVMDSPLGHEDIIPFCKVHYNPPVAKATPTIFRQRRRQLESLQAENHRCHPR